MQFSILGVPFKCAKEMFVWERIKWTLCILWAQILRWIVIAVVALVFLSSFSFFFSPAATDYILSDWAASVARYVGGVVGFLGVFFPMQYVTYFVYFEKQYKSFSREFTLRKKPCFFGWVFWKPYLITIIFNVLAGLIGGFLLSRVSLDNFVSWSGFLMSLILTHVFIHGGTWGFIPQRKLQDGQGLDFSV